MFLKWLIIISFVGMFRTPIMVKDTTRSHFKDRCLNNIKYRAKVVFGHFGRKSGNFVSDILAEKKCIFYLEIRKT